MIPKVNSTATTFSFWAKPDQITDATSMIFATGDLGGFNIADAWFGTTSPVVRFWDVPELGGLEKGELYLDGSSKADFVDWKYITVTIDSEGAKLYENGVLKIEKDGINLMNTVKNNALFLGVNFWDPSYKGLMDELTIYNKALSGTEVATLYANNGVPTQEGQVEIGTDKFQARTNEDGATTDLGLLTTFTLPEGVAMSDVAEMGVIVTNDGNDRDITTELTLDTVDGTNIKKIETANVTKNEGIDDRDYVFRSIVSGIDNGKTAKKYAVVPYAKYKKDGAEYIAYGNKKQATIASAEDFK